MGRATTRRFSRLGAGLLAMTLGLGLPGSASAASAMGDDLTEMSLEDLMSLEVSSFSKKDEKLSETPAAVFVITNDDIRRSGATSIPEALRMAPGLQVSQINASTWAISSRGFAGQFANKMLVMIDGRSVYTPLFSGVYWDVQDTRLADVDRIEVIRGPGGTVWGANAVNGVINIITKNATETQGLSVVSGVGTHDNYGGSVRYGGTFGDNTAWRAYGKVMDREGREAVNGGGDLNDDWNLRSGGGRVDATITSRDTLTFSGDFYDGDIHEDQTVITGLFPATTALVDKDQDVRGGNVLARWTHEFSETSTSALQVYYDQTSRESRLGVDEDRYTWDADLSHYFAVTDTVDVNWGAGYRYSWDETTTSVSTNFIPQNRAAKLASAYLQGSWDALPDLLTFTAGSKFEYNNFSGYEYQPSVRFLATPLTGHTFWGSVSRAVRTPSRADQDVSIITGANSFTVCGFALPFPPFTCLAQVPVTTATVISGNPDQASEELTSFELGYRFLGSETATLDVAAYYNEYDDLRSIEPNFATTGTIQNGIVLAPALMFDNRINGDTFGVELTSTIRVTDWWRVVANYSFIEMDIEPRSSSFDTASAAAYEGSTPDHIASLRSSWDMPFNTEADVMIYYMNHLESAGEGGGVRVPNNIGVSARLGWQPIEGLDISIIGQSLNDHRRHEFAGSVGTNASYIERGVYGRVSWNY